MYYDMYIITLILYGGAPLTISRGGVGELTNLKHVHVTVETGGTVVDSMTMETVVTNVTVVTNGTVCSY